MRKRSHFHIARLSADNTILTNFVTEKSTIMKWAFYLGAILPDLTVTQLFHPHFYGKSSDYVFERLSRIADKPEKGIVDAIILGEMAHYLCDFCCYAHIGGSIGKASEHLRYEKRLYKYLLDNYRHDMNQILFRLTRYDISGEILEQIKNTLEDYRKSEPSFDLDITNSIKLAAMIYHGLLLNQEDSSNDFVEEIQYVSLFK